MQKEMNRRKGDASRGRFMQERLKINFIDFRECWQKNNSFINLLNLFNLQQFKASKYLFQKIKINQHQLPNRYQPSSGSSLTLPLLIFYNFILVNQFPLNQQINSPNFSCIQLSSMFSMKSYQLNIYFTYFLLLAQRFIDMIRTNPISSKETLHYKNIIYQGNTTNHKIMNGSGILYFLTDKNLIISENIQNNHINGPSIFIYGKTTYHYGIWKDDKPHGICYFRINDVLIITQYSQGTLINSKQVFVYLQKNNTGAIMDYTPESGLKIKCKQQIYCHEHILKILGKGGFQTDKILFSLLKFINAHFNSKNSCIKLRYKEDSRYRFGIQNGCSVYFNEREEIQLFEIDQDKGNGNSQLSLRKNGHIYSVNDNASTIDNQTVVNPSLKYYEQLRHSLNQAVIKGLLSGSIKDLNSSRNNSINLNNLSIQIRQKEKKRIGQGTLSKMNYPSSSKKNIKQAFQEEKQPQKQFYYVNYLQQYPPRKQLKDQITKIRHIFQNINEQIEKVKSDQQTQTITENIPLKTKQIIVLTPQRTKTIDQQSNIPRSTKKKIFDFNINKVNRASDSSKKNKNKIFMESSEANAKVSKDIQRKQSSQYDWEYEQQPSKTPIHALQPQIKQFIRTQPKKQQKQNENQRLKSISVISPLPRKQSSQIQDEDMTNLNNLGRQQKQKKKNVLPLKIQRKNEPYKKSSHQKHTYHIDQTQAVKLKPQILSQPKSPLLPYRKKQAVIKEQQPFKILIPHRQGFPTSQQPLSRIQKQQRIRSYYLDLHARNLKY